MSNIISDNFEGSGSISFPGRLKGFFSSHHRQSLSVIAFLILAIVVPVTVYVSQQQQEVRQRASTVNIVAQVGNEPITVTEVNKTQNLYAYLQKKDKNSLDIKKQAIDLTIEKRLLEKEAQNRGILDEISKTIDAEIENFINKNGGTANAEKKIQTDIASLKSYLLSQKIKEKLQPLVVKSRIIDYLSIRYSWYKNPTSEETAFKDIAKRKIDEYYTKIQNGLDIKEAIKLRCQDPEINYLPFREHKKFYTETFDGKTCNEQAVNLEIDKDINKDWGYDDWLNTVFNLPIGQTSTVFTLDKPPVGLYFIIKVSEENQGKFATMNDFINDLRTKNNVQIYEN